MPKAPNERPILLEEFGRGKGIYYYPASGLLMPGETEPPPRPWPTPSTWEMPSPWPVSRLAITLTKSCDLNCFYCYNRFHPEAGSLDSESLKQVIRLISQQHYTPGSVGFIFTGGEPTLRPRELMETIDFAESLFPPRGISTGYTLYTNALGLDDELIHFLASRGVTIVISLDGPRVVHDRWRRDSRGNGSYGRVVHTIGRLKKRGLGNLLQARAVINDTDTDLVDVLETLLVQGFSRVHLIPAYGKHKDLFQGGIERWTKVLRVYEALLTRGIVVEVSPFFRIFRKLIYPRRFADSHFPCTAGREMLGVGHDGYFYLCHHFSGSSRKLGSIESGLPPLTAYIGSAPGVEDRSPCRECWSRHICGGPCYHRQFIGFGPDVLADCNHMQELLRQTVVSFTRLCVKVPEVMKLIADNLVYIPLEIGRQFAEAAKKSEERGPGSPAVPMPRSTGNPYPGNLVVTGEKSVEEEEDERIIR